MLLNELKILPDSIDTNFSTAVAEFVEKHGLKSFHGGQATVIAKGNHVWRAWFSDKGYEQFLEYALKNQSNPHIVKVLSKVRTHVMSVKNMKDLKLKFVKLEKLTAIESNTMLSDAMDMISDYSFTGKPLPDKLEELIELMTTMKISVYVDAEMEELQEEVKKNPKFFETMIDLIKHHKANDFTVENIMMRGNVPVITDPISSN